MEVTGRKSALVSALCAGAIFILAPTQSPAVVVGSLATSYDQLLPGGGIVAAGASLSGREDMVANVSAMITISGIPGGSTVERAYLYWVVSGGSDTTVTFESQAVVATDLGTAGSTCWTPLTNSAARADVTALVSGNGVYTVEGLPSDTNQDNPDTDGVSLVVIYSGAASDPGRRVIVRDGIITEAVDLVADTFASLVVPVDTTGRFHVVAGDGQTAGDGDLTFAGTTLATDAFVGTDGNLWDTLAYDVALTSGMTSAEWTSGTGPDCLAYAAVTLDYNQALCGNELIEAGEECDDGNTASGDCCSATCGFESSESPCDNGDDCSGDTCDGEGTCGAGTGASGCDDSSPCTVETCNVNCISTPTVDPTCEGGTKSLLLMLDKADEADAIKWKLIGGPETDQADLGDPVATTAYTLCVFDSSGAGDTLETELTFGPSANWASKDPKGFKYKDKLGTLDGVGKALVKTGAAGKSKMFVRAKGVNVPMVTPFSATELFDQNPRVVVQLFNSTTPKCWDSEFLGAKKNSASKFKAKTP